MLDEGKQNKSKMPKLRGACVEFHFLKRAHIFWGKEKEGTWLYIKGDRKSRTVFPLDLALNHTYYCNHRFMLCYSSSSSPIEALWPPF